jgi:hypothetical protein
MTRKYAKVKTVDDYPVSVAQVRRLRRNCDWALDSRKADIGTWGRLATDADATVTGTPLTRILSPVSVDLSQYDEIRFGVVVDGDASATTWSVVLSMTGGGTNDVTLSFTNPGTGASSTNKCVPGYGSVRTCTPHVTVTRLTGTGSLALRYIGIWGHHAEDHEYGPQLLQTALAADLLVALDRAKYALNHRSPMIGWFGSHTFTNSLATALQWFALLDKLDDDETLQSKLTADGIVYETVSSAGKTWGVTYSDNGGNTNAMGQNSAGTDVRSAFSLPLDGSSYDVSTPMSRC